MIVIELCTSPVTKKVGPRIFGRIIFDPRSGGLLVNGNGWLNALTIRQLLSPSDTPFHPPARAIDREIL
jgi:hypothetical protein